MIDSQRLTEALSPATPPECLDIPECLDLILTCLAIAGPSDSSDDGSYGQRGSYEEDPIFGRADGEDPGRTRPQWPRSPKSTGSTM